MNWNDPNILLWVVGQIVTAAAIWGGIRSDIRNIRTQVEAAQEAANDAHKRMDSHLERHR